MNRRDFLQAGAIAASAALPQPSPSSQTRTAPTSPGADADVRVYATNRLRPNADAGGINQADYHIRIGAVWTRYGDPGGTLAHSTHLAARRRIYTHINNTNPILIDGSPERRSVEGAGWRVASDGMDLHMPEEPSDS